MKKQIAFSLVLVFVLSLLAGCAGTAVVYYGDCTCPTGSTPMDPTNPPAEGAIKTGLAIITSVGKSVSATNANYDVTLVAVTVDNNGVIESCIIDSLGTDITFDATGTVTSDLNKEILTKNELGDSYGMGAISGIKKEWYQQAAALADYAEGKTVAQLKNGAITNGYATEGTDLAASATIYLGGYVSAIETAVNNAKHLGAQAGDELKLASISSYNDTVSATAEKKGNAQLNVDVTALTVKDGVITSCYIDSVQAKVAFDTTGTITSDITSAVKTKNEQGDAYNMVAWGGAKYEWYQQAANFAAYVTGKTAAQVAGIAVNESTKPTDADLSAGVTIAIGGFQALIAKAMK